MKTDKEQLVNYLRKIQNVQFGLFMSKTIHTNIGITYTGFYVGIYTYDNDERFVSYKVYSFSTYDSPRVNEATFLDFMDVINENKK